MTDAHIEQLSQRIRRFEAERDWAQFHSAKNLVMALGVEVAEIVELFQWLTEEQSKRLDAEKLAELRDEIGDVMVYLLEFCDKLGIDPLEAAEQKMDKNEHKYPADLVRSKALKYTAYQSPDK